MLSTNINKFLEAKSLWKIMDFRWLKIVNRAYSRENYGVAVRKSEDSKELLDEINTVISAFLDEKKFNLIKNIELSE